MPYLHLRLSMQPSPDDAARIASVLTDLTAEVLRKKRELTAVSIESVAPQRWAIGGVPLAGQPVRSSFLDVAVSAGTNSTDEMAEYIARAHAALEALVGPLAPASYVAIHELAADAWGYQGRTQASRAGAATARSGAALGPSQLRAVARSR
jgi:4-oxalocrotonate tautomerase